MINEILYIIFLVFVPALELRAAIPYGIIATDIHWLVVFLVAVLTNFILGVILYPLLDIIVKTMTRIKIFNKLWNLYIERTQEKIKKYVNKYGELGVAAFIGVPLPGSGTYSGSIAAYLLGMKYRRFLLANAIGVMIAGTIVTIIVLSGSTMLGFLIKTPI